MDKEYISPWDVFKGPFTIAENGKTIWFNNHNNICFDILCKPELGPRIVDLMNNEGGRTSFDDIGVSSDHEYICDGHTPLLQVRRGYIVGVLGKTREQEDETLRDFVYYTAECLGFCGETKVGMLEDANKCLRQEIGMYREIINHLQDNAKSITESMLECLGEGIYQSNGNVDGTFEEKNGKTYIRFDLEDEKGLLAEWYEDWKYGVLQHNDMEDHYYGYLLLPKVYTFRKVNGAKKGTFLCISYDD